MTSFLWINTSKKEILISTLRKVSVMESELLSQLGVCGSQHNGSLVIIIRFVFRAQARQVYSAHATYTSL
jgi:hypothetical protein